MSSETSHITCYTLSKYIIYIYLSYQMLWYNPTFKIKLRRHTMLWQIYFSLSSKQALIFNILKMKIFWFLTNLKLFYFSCEGSMIPAWPFSAYIQGFFTLPRFVWQAKKTQKCLATFSPFLQLITTLVWWVNIWSIQIFGWWKKL